MTASIPSDAPQQTHDRPSPPGAAPWMPQRWVLLVLLCLVIVVRGRAMLAQSESLALDPDGYDHLAAYLTRGGYGHDLTSRSSWSNTPLRLREFGWTWPYVPTAYRPPLYPLLLAMLRTIAKDGAIGFAHVVLGAVTVWAVWRLGPRLGLSPLGSLFAAALATVDPILVYHSAQVMTETLATALAAVALLAICWATEKKTLLAMACAGGLFGLCILCRPTFVAWFASVAAALPFVLSGRVRRRTALGAAFVVTAAIVVAPWAVRNFIQFGRPIFTTTHGGYTLLLANNPDFYEYLWSGEWGDVWDAWRFNRRWESQTYEFRANTPPTNVILDEPACDALAYRQAWNNIRAEPGMFAYSCLVRVGRLWGVLPHRLSTDESPTRRGLRYTVAIWYTLEFLLAAVGAWFLRRRLLRPPWLFGVLLLASFTLVHAVYWSDMRMRAPLIVVVVLAAAQGATVLASARRVLSPKPAAA